MANQNDNFRKTVIFFISYKIHFILFKYFLENTRKLVENFMQLILFNTMMMIMNNNDCKIILFGVVSGEVVEY
jgi:hypothetical protein